MAENNKVQLKREEVVGDEVVLSDINPKTSTDAVEDYQGMSLSEILDRIYNTINNKLSRNVNSVNGRTGVVVLTAEDVGLGNVSNVSYADIKRWVIEQIKQAFKDHTMKMFDYLEQVIDFAENHDETYDGTPFFSEMGYKYRNGYEDKRACIGYFYYENNSLQAAWKMLNTIGETDNSIIYNEKLEYNNPSLYEDKDYRGGKLGVNIHKDETALKIMNESSTNKASSGLYIDKDAIVPYVHFFDGVYGKAVDWNTPPDDPDALLYYDQSNIPSDVINPSGMTRRVKIFIDGVEVSPFVSNPDNTEDPILQMYLRHDLKLNDIIITNFNDEGYYNSHGLYPGMLDSLTCRQFAIGKVVEAPDTKNVNRPYKIDLYQIKINVCHGLRNFETDGFDDSGVIKYGPQGTSVGISQYAQGEAMLYRDFWGGGLGTSIAFNKAALPEDVDEVNLSGINTSTAERRAYRAGKPATRTTKSLILPAGQTKLGNEIIGNVSSYGDAALIGTNYSLCVMPRLIYDNYKLLTSEPANWETSYTSYFEKKEIEPSGHGNYAYFQIEQGTGAPSFEDGEYYMCGNEGFNNAKIGKNIPSNSSVRDTNLGFDKNENDSLIGVNLEKRLFSEDNDFRAPVYAENLSGLRVHDQDSGLTQEDLGQSIYEPLTEQPEDWSTDYGKYFCKVYIDFPHKTAHRGIFHSSYGNYEYYKLSHLVSEAPTFYPNKYYEEINSKIRNYEHTGGLGINVGDHLRIDRLPQYEYTLVTVKPDPFDPTQYYHKTYEGYTQGHEGDQWHDNYWYIKHDEPVTPVNTGKKYYDAGKLSVKVAPNGGIVGNGDGELYVQLSSSWYSADDNGFENGTNAGGLCYIKPDSNAEDACNAGIGVARGLGLRLSRYYPNSSSNDDIIAEPSVPNDLMDAGWPLTISVNIADPQFGTHDWFNNNPPAELFGGLRYIVGTDHDNNRMNSSIGVRVNDSSALKGDDIHKGTKGLCIDTNNVLGVQIAKWSIGGFAYDSAGNLTMTGYMRADLTKPNSIIDNWDKCYKIKDSVYPSEAAENEHTYHLTPDDFEKKWNSEPSTIASTDKNIYKRITEW